MPHSGLFGRTRVAVGATIVALAAVFAVVSSDSMVAQAAPRRATLTSGPMIVAAHDKVEVMVTNFGPRPVLVTLGVALADGLSSIGSTGPLVLEPRTSAFFSPNNTELIVKIVGYVHVEARAPRDLSGIRASMQVVDPSGRTQIFTDGFESGDTSAW